MKKTIILSLILITAFSGCRSANDINNNSETASPDSVFSLSDEAVSSTSENISKKDNGEYVSYSLTSEEFKKFKHSFAEAYCTDASVIALISDGNVITWGNNYRGKVGNGKIDSHAPDAEITSSPPFCIDFCSDIVSVGCSLSTAYAITESGDVFMWGRNGFGETGIEAGHITEPRKININDKIKKVASDNATNLFLSEDGKVFRSGIDILKYATIEDLNQNVAFEIPYGSDKPYPLTVAEPGYVDLDLPFKCKDVSVEILHYSFLSEEGEVYVQGSLIGDYDKKLPYLVHNELYKISFPEKITNIESGSNVIVALSESGNVYLYGRRESVFFDEASDSEISENVFKKGGLENIISICCGTYCITAIDSSGNVWGFGIDNWGVIDSKNNDTDTFSYEIINHPRKMFDGVSKCTNDTSHSIVILKDGQMLIQGSDACKIISYLNY